MWRSDSKCLRVSTASTGSTVVLYSRVCISPDLGHGTLWRACSSKNRDGFCECLEQNLNLLLGAGHNFVLHMNRPPVQRKPGTETRPPTMSNASVSAPKNDEDMERLVSMKPYF